MNFTILTTLRLGDGTTAMSRMHQGVNLSPLLKECGFADITVVETERMNGHCPEMELVAKQP